NPIVMNGISTGTSNHDFFSQVGNGYLLGEVQAMEDNDYKQWALNDRRKQRMQYRQAKKRRREEAKNAQASAKSTNKFYNLNEVSQKCFFIACFVLKASQPAISGVRHENLLEWSIRKV